jgi:GDP-L-fucose synthase
MEALRQDFNCRPVEGVDGSNIDAVIEKMNKYGVTDSSVEIWGTGTPLREFLWSEDMADASVFVMENVDWADLCAGMAEPRNCHIT